jgi:hypothetical protein
MIAENIFCMKKFFIKRKLVGEGFLQLEESVDPQSIIWENLGFQFYKKVFRILIIFLLFLIFFVISFYGMFNFTNIEK